MDVTPFLETPQIGYIGTNLQHGSLSSPRALRAAVVRARLRARRLPGVRREGPRPHQGSESRVSPRAPRPTSEPRTGDEAAADTGGDGECASDPHAHQDRVHDKRCQDHHDYVRQQWYCRLADHQGRQATSEPTVGRRTSPEHRTVSRARGRRHHATLPDHGRLRRGPDRVLGPPAHAAARSEAHSGSALALRPRRGSRTRPGPAAAGGERLLAIPLQLRRPARRPDRPGPHAIQPHPRRRRDHPGAPGGSHHQPEAAGHGDAVECPGLDEDKRLPDRRHTAQRLRRRLRPLPRQDRPGLARAAGADPFPHAGQRAQVRPARLSGDADERRPAGGSSRRPCTGASSRPASPTYS